MQKRLSPYFSFNSSTPWLCQTLVLCVLSIFCLKSLHADEADQVWKSALDQSGFPVIDIPFAKRPTANTTRSEYVADRSTAPEPQLESSNPTQSSPVSIFNKNDQINKNNQTNIAQTRIVTPAVPPLLARHTPTATGFTPRRPIALSNEVQAAKAKLQQAEKSVNQSIVISQPGAPAQTKGLMTARSGVPYLPNYKIKRVKRKNGKYRSIKVALKSIPRANLGIEPTITASSLTGDLKIPKLKLNKLPPLKSPPLLAKKELKQWLKVKKIQVAKGWKSNIKKDKDYVKPVTEKEIAKVQLEPRLIETTADLDVKPFSKNELLMLSALILNRSGKKCHLVAGLYENLRNHKELKYEARYNLGICQKTMGLYSDASTNLIEVAKNPGNEFFKPAVESLVSGFPADLQGKIAMHLRKLNDREALGAAINDQLNYLLTKERYFGGKYSQAIAFAQKIPKSAPQYPKAQFIMAIAEYSKSQHGKKQKLAALKRLVDLKKWTEANQLKDDNLTTLINLNIARMNFIKGNYKNSFNHYMKTKKSHPLWVESMTEQGWAQLSLKDFSGAIGNMYSLQSPFFKTIFKPQTHAIRTIGYINICQYGDAYRSLTMLERQYAKWLSDVAKYKKRPNSKNNYYVTVKRYLKGKSDKNVDGLPYQIIREMARQKEFLNLQKSINRKVDEIDQYRFLHGMIKKDLGRTKISLRASKARASKFRADLKKIKKDSALAKNADKWKAQLAAEKRLQFNLRHELEATKESLKAFGRRMNTSVAYMKKEKYGYQRTANKTLRNQLQRINRQLNSTLANNEILRYEIFSGSGENIRYQVAGGKTKKAKRIPAHVKPKKIVNWDFDGEFWEDEIGSYRSSLKNNCPKTPTYVSGGVK